jgi:hypothetical protein
VFQLLLGVPRSISHATAERGSEFIQPSSYLAMIAMIPLFVCM